MCIPAWQCNSKVSHCDTVRSDCAAAVRIPVPPQGKDSNNVHSVTWQPRKREEKQTTVAKYGTCTNKYKKWVIRRRTMNTQFQHSLSFTVLKYCCTTEKKSRIEWSAEGKKRNKEKTLDYKDHESVGCGSNTRLWYTIWRCWKNKHPSGPLWP